MTGTNHGHSLSGQGTSDHTKRDRISRTTNGDSESMLQGQGKRAIPDGGQQLLQPKANDLSQDELFSTLSSQRRRHVLRQLLKAGATMSVRDLTAGVAAGENHVSEHELTYKQRKRVYTSLHQTHLPKLRSVGLIDYDNNRGTVSLTDKTPLVEPYIDIDTERQWCDYYLGLGAILGAFAVVVGANIAIFDTIPDIAVGGIAALSILALSTWHALTTR